MLAVLVTMTSCVTTGLNIKLDVTCEEFQEKSKDLENIWEIDTHDKITVRLCANPSTGYSWSYEMTNEGVMALEDHDYEEPEGGAVGAYGVDVWTFEAVEPGTTEIRMQYSRSWEEDIEWTYTMSVTVE
jgi:inhibitor of cysteine peptidase